MAHCLIKYFIFILLISSVSASFAADVLNPESTDSLKNYYLKVKSGIVQPTVMNGNTGLNNGSAAYTGGLSIGRIINDFISFDLEYIYRAKSKAEYYVPGSRQDSTTWSVSSQTAMLNISVNLMKDSRIKPYFRAGVGISANKGSTYYKPLTDAQYFYPGKTNNSAAWQIGTGINFDTNDIFSYEIEYMFVNRGKVKTQPYSYSSTDPSMTSIPPIKGYMRDNTLTIGLKYKF